MNDVSPVGASTLQLAQRPFKCLSGSPANCRIRRIRPAWHSGDLCGRWSDATRRPVRAVADCFTRDHGNGSPLDNARGDGSRLPPGKPLQIVRAPPNHAGHPKNVLARVRGSRGGFLSDERVRGGASRWR